MDRTLFNLTAGRVTAIACVSLLAGCSGVRLQSPQEAAQEASHSVHAHARQECVKHRDSTAYFECKKRADENYKAWREERSKLADGK